ncbi:MAG: hypothetical protein JHC32_01915 [Candidatus Aminicenantes bacterium]|nr:hypothetical protein [Candidatus Aminicenantes bacterium]
MPIIKSISARKILNSHVEFTSEFIIELIDGSVGIGSSPMGETISIYEDREFKITPELVITRLHNDGLFEREITQEELDEYLTTIIPFIGRNNAFSLSLAFFKATTSGKSGFQVLASKDKKKLSPPRLCLNILNGGKYAYTNPVLSDFSEFMLVAKNNDIEEVISEHNEIQKEIKSELNLLERISVGKQMVHHFKTADNRHPLELLVKVLDHLGFRNKYDLMIDASAGDLWHDGNYAFSLTDKKILSSEELNSYWLSIIKDYNLRFLEDPFYEKDYEAWAQLTREAKDCLTIGDNLYSSDTNRIKIGHDRKLSHGVVIKPNQAGTITKVKEALTTAQDLGLVVITSHRSISTEETFLSFLTCVYQADYIKIGPLLTDYSSVLRLNEIIRLTS